MRMDKATHCFKAKSLITIAAILSFVTFPATATTIAYWNSVSGRTMTDLTGNGYDLTQASGGNAFVNSAANLSTLPLPNPDGAISGGSGSIFLNNHSTAAHTSTVAPFQLTSASSFTFEGWLNGSGVTGVIAGDRHQSSSPSSYLGWYLVISGSGSINFYANTGSIAQASGTTAVNDGDSHHFAATWNHLTNEMSLYIDGSLENTATLSTVNSYTTTAFAVAGRSTSGTSYTSTLLDNASNQVRIDELRFSNQALAPTEFLNHVPEPSTALLSLLGLALLLRRHR